MLLQLGLILLATVISCGCFASAIDGRVPQNVKIRAINSYAVGISWDPPIEPNGDVVGYSVRWFLNSEPQEEIYVPFMNSSYIFTSLQPEQNISANVRAVSRRKDSELLDYISGPSNEVSVITPALKEDISTTTPVITMTEGPVSNPVMNTTDGSTSTTSAASVLLNSMVLLLSSTFLLHKSTRLPG